MPLALAPLGAVFAGIMALLLILAIGLLIDRIIQAIDDSAIPWPVADGMKYVFRGVGSAVGRVVAYLINLAKAGLTIVTAPARAIITLVDSIVVGLARVGGWIRHLVYSEIPRLWNELYRLYNSAIQYATNLAYQLYYNAVNLIYSTRAYLERVISSGISNAVAYAGSLFRIAATQLGAAIASLSAYSQALFNMAMVALGNAVFNLTRQLIQTRAELAAYAARLAQWSANTAIGISIDWARKYTDQIIDWYNRSLASGVAGALAGPWDIALPAIDTIALALPESVAAVLARIGAIPRVIPRDVAASVGAVAAVGAVAIDWVAECGVPLCRNARPFGDALAGLEDLALIAAIFELVVEGVADPNGAAHTIVTDIGKPMSTVLHEFGDMVGLGR